MIIKIHKGNDMALEVMLLCSAQSAQLCMHVSLGMVQATVPSRWGCSSNMGHTGMGDHLLASPQLSVLSHAC